ncbi:MAG: aromatic amino acid lyase [Deltaproteobacteria bacterium]|nr:aromatic amino acid lyase [Deltaproteobacteria bacterium]
MNPVRIRHDRDLTPGEICAVADDDAAVEFDDETGRMLDERRRQVVEFVESSNVPAYGFNRGFGHNVRLAVDADRAAELQRNLIRSHASAVGEPAPLPVIRAAMLMRSRSLARGHSGVRSEVPRKLVEFLNAGITPVVPRFGSVSASGDLAPLSHIALGLMGEGEVFVGDERLNAAAALARAGIEPLVLEMKEGLALNNGVQFSTAYGVLAAARLESLWRTACVGTSLTLQVMLGADTPWREDLHALRPHAGSVRTAAVLRALTANSPIREAHRPYDIDGEIQDPYNLRCAAQILGAARTLIDRANETFAIEANSVTDNPILLSGEDDAFTDIVSGGHFHGMPVAVDLYGLLQAAAMIASLVGARCARYVDEARNRGLGADLKWPGPTDDPEWNARQAASSGMMAPEYVAASLTNWLWGQCMPTHLFSISTDAGQEDHVSMAANVAIRAYDALPRLAEALAVELAFAAQAAAIRKRTPWLPSRARTASGEVTLDRHEVPEADRRLCEAGEAVLREIEPVFPVVTVDRPLSADLSALAALVLDGAIERCAARFGVFAAVDAPC